MGEGRDLVIAIARNVGRRLPRLIKYEIDFGE